MQDKQLSMESDQTAPVDQKHGPMVTSNIKRRNDQKYTPKQLNLSNDELRFDDSTGQK